MVPVARTCKQPCQLCLAAGLPVLWINYGALLSAIGSRSHQSDRVLLGQQPERNLGCEDVVSYGSHIKAKDFKSTTHQQLYILYTLLSYSYVFCRQRQSLHFHSFTIDTVPNLHALQISPPSSISRIARIGTPRRQTSRVTGASLHIHCQEVNHISSFR
jgi:hypothetical protein